MLTCARPYQPDAGNTCTHGPTQVEQGLRELTVAQVPATVAPGWSLRHAPLQQWAFLRQPNLDAAMHCEAQQADQTQMGLSRQPLTRRNGQSSSRCRSSTLCACGAAPFTVQRPSASLLPQGTPHILARAQSVGSRVLLAKLRVTAVCVLATAKLGNSNALQAGVRESNGGRSASLVDRLVLRQHILGTGAATPHAEPCYCLKHTPRLELTSWQLPKAAPAESFWQGRALQQSAAAAQPRWFRLMHWRWEWREQGGAVKVETGGTPRQ